MKSFPAISPLENIYLSPINTHANINKPFIKSSNIGTGFGKTYMAFLAATRMLIKAKEENERLICIFSAPLNNQLDISDIAKNFLEKEKIPAIKVIANYKLEEHDNPSGIFQTIQQICYSSRFKSKKCRYKNIFEEVVDLLKGEQTNVNSSGVETDNTDVNKQLQLEEVSSPESRLAQINHIARIIKRKKARDYLHDTLETKEEVEEELKRLGRKLHGEVRTLIGSVLKLDKQPSYYDQDFQLLVELLYPWSLIQSKGIGLLSMTASKLLMKHHVQTSRRNFKPLDIRQIIHEAESLGLRNLDNTRFLIFIDEADAAKSFIEKQLSGKLIQNSLITQCIGALYREIGDLVYSEGNKVKNIENYLVAADSGKPRPSISLSASLDLLKEQLDLRKIRLGLATEMSEYRKAEGIDLTEVNINELAQLNKDHLCISVRRHDEAIQKLGAAGLFASGTMGFLNGHSLEHIALDTRYTREMVVGGQNVLEQELTGCSKPLRHWFEMLLEALSLSHQLNVKNSEFKLTRAPIFNPESNKNIGIETHATPLRALLRAIANTRIQEALSKRTHFEREMLLDIDYAFRAPQMIYALRRMKSEENFYDLDENLFVPAMAEISYRLSSAEAFLEQLISKKAYLNDSDSINDMKDKGHGIFLISATGGYDSSHMNGFANAYLKNSDFVEFLKMTDEDNKAAENAQQEANERRSVGIHALRREDIKPGYLMKLALSYMNNDRDLIESSSKADVANNLGYLLNNKFKREELNRILTSIEHISGNNRDPFSISDSSESEKMSAAMGHIHSSLMLTQTLRTLRLTLHLLSNDYCKEGKQSPVCMIKKNLLYIIGDVSGFTPVLVIFYDRNTDKEILNLTDIERQQLEIVLGKKVTLPSILTMNDLITRKSDCKVTVVSAWESASRGLNIVSDHSDNENKSDLDALFLIMSRHYTSAHAKWNDNPAQALSEEIERSQYIYEHLALKGGHQLRLKDLSLKTREVVPGAIDFLNEQHRLILAVSNQQGIGRIERCRVKQHQYLFIDSEILQEIANANQTMFTEQPELKKTLSLLNLKVLAFALDFVQEQAFTPEDPIEAGYIQDDAIELYEQEKGKTLNAFLQLRSGEINEEQGNEIINRWNALNSIEWLTDPEQFCRSLLKQGWTNDFVQSLWVDTPSSGQSYVYAPKHSANELTRLLLSPLEIRSQINQGKIIHYYKPEDKTDFFKLPRELAVHSTINAQLTNRFNQLIPRPHTEPDRNGIWGEYVTDLWFRTLIPEGKKLPSDTHIAEIFELFDLYYIVKNNNESILLAVDAKNWSQQADASFLADKVIAKAPQKIALVEAWALTQGIDRTVGIYFNSRPISGSQGDIKRLCKNNVISVAGIIRESDVDLVLPSTEPLLNKQQQMWNSDPHLFVNKNALNFIREQIK